MDRALRWPLELATAVACFLLVGAFALALPLCADTIRDAYVSLPWLILFCGTAIASGSALAAGWLVRRHHRQIRAMSSLLTLRQLPEGMPFSATPNPAGDVHAAILSLREKLVGALDARRSIRQQAEETDRYETEFIKSLSHELRTPLNAIIGFTQVVLDEIDGPVTASQRQDLETILASGHHLTDLVDDVLDLAAMQSARFRLERTRLDVRPIIKAVTQLLEGERRGRPVEVEVTLPDDPLEVLADPKRLRQIVTNLASNAMKFTERGFVRLSAAQHESEVVITVEDSGPGIGSVDLALIFEEFSQVGDIRRKGQGSGLGLAICRKLAALHGGHVSVDSVVGRGSEFRVHLPSGEVL